MISFIVPAHNEEQLIGRTLSAVHEAARAVAEPYEIIVSNDASTDRTGEIATAQGARVIAIDRRQIAASRNAGAQVAEGEWLIFVDADTMVTEPALRAAVRELRSGVVGGGCAVRFDGSLPFYAVVMERLLPPILRLLRLAPGCFIFCTRSAFLAVGRFDESLFCAEEVMFVNELKRHGRFVILREFVITSARKLRTRTALDLLRIGFRLGWGGRPAIQQREGLEYWYGPRED